MRRFADQAAVTLLEMLIVMAIVGVLAGMTVASFSSNAASQLQSVASLLGQDLEYARSLAVNNGDSYRVTFDIANNRWTLTHSGANAALDSLPITPFHLPSDPANQQTVSLTNLPSV